MRFLMTVFAMTMHIITTKNKAMVPHIGAVIHHHDQSMTLHNFNTRNATNNVVPNPSALTLTSSLILFHLIVFNPYLRFLLTFSTMARHISMIVNKARPTQNGYVTNRRNSGLKHMPILHVYNAPSRRKLKYTILFPILFCINCQNGRSSSTGSPAGGSGSVLAGRATLPARVASCAFFLSSSFAPSTAQSDFEPSIWMDCATMSVA